MIQNLPEKWYVRSNTRKEDGIIVHWFNKTHGTCLNDSFRDDGFYYYSEPAMYGKYHDVTQNRTGFTEISFDDFVRLVLKEQQPQLPIYN